MIICNNEECPYWKYENEVGHEKNMKIDNTNCTVHDGEEIANGNCLESDWSENKE